MTDIGLHVKVSYKNAETGELSPLFTGVNIEKARASAQHGVFFHHLKVEEILSNEGNLLTRVGATWFTPSVKLYVTTRIKNDQ